MLKKLLSVCVSRWFVFVNPVVRLRSNVGLSDVLRLARTLWRCSASGYIHSSRIGVPTALYRATSTFGSLTGPISFSRSPLMKKRIASFPPFTCMPYWSRWPVASGVSSGTSMMFRNVTLSLMHAPVASVVLMQRT